MVANYEEAGRWTPTSIYSGPSCGDQLPSSYFFFFFQSDVIDNHYGTTYNIKLLLDRRWQGDESDRTRHFSRKTISTPFAPQIPVLINSKSPNWNEMCITVSLAPIHWVFPLVLQVGCLLSAFRHKLMSVWKRGKGEARRKLAAPRARRKLAAPEHVCHFWAFSSGGFSGFAPLRKNKFLKCL